MASTLSIGRLAQAAGVNVETIRYYQRRGLLAVPPKPLGGQRRYPEDAVKCVRFIKRAQALGFTLDEAGALLKLDRARACAPTRALAARKRALLDRKIADLAALRGALDDLIRQCATRRGRTGCPIIETLTRD
ncbi:MAG: MerR family transcriptional regulator [Rhodanobacteraceae bacterium]|nr:MAG: MerR family transcriptional regulator [Rhodanobacteraceae bacterium]